MLRNSISKVVKKFRCLSVNQSCLFVSKQYKKTCCRKAKWNTLHNFNINRDTRKCYSLPYVSEHVKSKPLQKIYTRLAHRVDHSKYYFIISISCTVIAACGLISTVKPMFKYSIETVKHLFLKSVSALTPNISRYNFIADVVDTAGPAVVFLEIKGEHPESGKRITVSNGSGFIVRNNGLILTSAHVVANKAKVVVKLHNGDIFGGTVTAVDPIYDLATVKIDVTEKLPFIPLGKSSEIRPGEFVVAMGSPLSLSNTVTSGIVSSSLRASRELGLDNKNMQYIQTDAVISYGNSGGPLVNLDGKAIGINNLKVTSGISFAIPADYAIGFVEEAERVMERANNSTKPSYIDSGKESFHKRRYMGITMLTLTPLILNELRDKLLGFPDVDKGVYVHKVIVGSPAYEGGLHAGDIIININGEQIKSTADIYQVVEKDSRLRITAIRGVYLQKVDVITEELF